ncbi:MAG: hypothetical protein AB1403_23190 [Candidatus Riflebacteria bacterium]
MSTFRKAIFILGFICFTLFGFLVGLKFSSRNVRPVETTRMENCLNLYQDYRQNQNQKELALKLATMNLTPEDFQKIIDRFIYYRTRKSSIDQAMKLLQAFRMGYDIEPVEVVEVSGFASESFRLDAEVLAVFEANPDLIRKAFEG